MPGMFGEIFSERHQGTEAPPDGGLDSDGMINSELHNETNYADNPEGASHEPHWLITAHGEIGLPDVVDVQQDTTNK